MLIKPPWSKPFFKPPLNPPLKFREAYNSSYTLEGKINTNLLFYSVRSGEKN
jgi:hypothetical protein